MKSQINKIIEEWIDNKFIDGVKSEGDWAMGYQLALQDLRNRKEELTEAIIRKVVKNKSYKELTEDAGFKLQEIQEWEEKLNDLLWKNIDWNTTPERPMKALLHNDLKSFISTLLAEQEARHKREIEEIKQSILEQID
jgi:hypothetical protein